MSTVISRLYTWVTDKTNGVKITASKMDAENDQLIASLNRKVLCSGSAPSSPIAGQTWVDTTNKLVKWYRNNEWVIIGIVHTSSSAPATMQSGDVWIDSSGSENVLKVRDKANSSWITISSFTPSVSNALSGSIIQHVFSETASVITTTTTVPNDDTIPQNTEGVEVLTRAITPNHASNKLRFFAVVVYDAPTSGSVEALSLFQDTTADALVTVSSNVGTATGNGIMVLIWEMASGTTSSTTFKLRIGSNDTNTLTVNGENSSRKYGGVMKSILMIDEVKA